MATSGLPGVVRLKLPSALASIAKGERWWEDGPAVRAKNGTHISSTLATCLPKEGKILHCVRKRSSVNEKAARCT